MSKNSILTDKEIADGLILTCQAHPTSESIYVAMMFRRTKTLNKFL
jgi:hypothetical protein